MTLSRQIVEAIRKQVRAAMDAWPSQIAQSGGLPPSTMPQPSEDWPGYSDAFHEHPQFFDAHKIWGRDVEDGLPVTGDGLVWDGTQWAIGPVGGGEGGEGVDFKAYLATDTDIDSMPGTAPMTDVKYNRGELYDSVSGTWTPPAGPVSFMFRTRLETNSGDVAAIIAKNGSGVFSKAGGRYSVSGNAVMEGYWHDDANGTDMYQLAIANSTASGNLLASDTYWSGMTGGSGGGGGGGGGGVPAPFVYMVDTDGAYLLDSDGAYLYERLI